MRLVSLLHTIPIRPGPNSNLVSTMHLELHITVLQHNIKQFHIRSQYQLRGLETETDCQTTIKHLYKYLLFGTRATIFTCQNIKHLIGVVEECFNAGLGPMQIVCCDFWLLQKPQHFFGNRFNIWDDRRNKLDHCLGIEGADIVRNVPRQILVGVASWPGVGVAPTFAPTIQCVPEDISNWWQTILGEFQWSSSPQPFRLHFLWSGPTTPGTRGKRHCSGILTDNHSWSNPRCKWSNQKYFFGSKGRPPTHPQVSCLQAGCPPTHQSAENQMSYFATQKFYKNIINIWSLNFLVSPVTFLFSVPYIHHPFIHQK